MSGTFSDSLALVAPRLQPCLVTSEQLRSLMALGAALPPVHRGGFEYRLGSGPGLDLQQAIETTGPDRSRFRAFAERGEGRLARPLAAASDLLDELAPLDADDPPWLRRLWLEFDATAGGSPAPSYFLSLRGQGPSADALAGHLDRVFERLAGATLNGAARRALSRVGRSGPAAARITDLGCMASRGRQALRMILSCQTTTEVLGGLEGLDWPGEAAPVRNWARRLFDQAPELRVCVDVTDRVLPWVALEVPVNAAGGDNPLALDLFELLVGEGLCGREEQAALLGWPGIVTPQDVRGSWPEELIAASILGDADSFTALRCKFSHFKLTLGETREPVVKAYFGHFETWLRPAQAE